MYRNYTEVDYKININIMYNKYTRCPAEKNAHK